LISINRGGASDASKNSSREPPFSQRMIGWGEQGGCAIDRVPVEPVRPTSSIRRRRMASRDRHNCAGNALILYQRKAEMLLNQISGLS